MIRSAVPGDTPVICGLIRELAEYEKLTHQVVLEEHRFHEHLFGSQPCVEAILAEERDQVVGFALFFSNYSTFLGRPGIYLEDLYVKPEYRGAGHGRALLAEVARLAVARDCGRLEWAVLNWNQPSIEFYNRLGGEPLEGWTTYRLAGEALANLGRSC
jgi:GNAT superfamily N-acetyltransferase